MQIGEVVSRRWGACGTAGLSSPAVELLRPTENDSRWVTPEVFLPIQDIPARADHWLPRLCLALLVDTLKCLGSHGRRRREAWEWVRSEAEHCFSFIAVCAVLQLNAQAVRRKVAQRFGPGLARAGDASGLPRRRVRRRNGAGGLAL
jgi:hypothetical protein